MSETKRYRLLARAEFHGAIREPGYVFTLAEGEVGPHRTVVASNHGAQITDHIATEQRLEDVPLYEEIVEKADAAEEAHAEPSLEQLKADLEAAHGKIETLARELADKHIELAAANEKIKTIGAAVTA